MRLLTCPQHYLSCPYSVLTCPLALPELSFLTVANVKTSCQFSVRTDTGQLGYLALTPYGKLGFLDVDMKSH